MDDLTKLFLGLIAFLLAVIATLLGVFYDYMTKKTDEKFKQIEARQTTHYNMLTGTMSSLKRLKNELGLSGQKGEKRTDAKKKV